MASIESCIALLRCIYLTQGVGPAVAAARRALELEPPGSAWRRQALIGLGQALYLRGNSDEARAPLLEAQRLPHTHDHAIASAAVLAYLALVDLDSGDRASAKRHARASCELLEAHGLVETYVATNTHLALAGLHAAGADIGSELEELELAARLSAPACPSHWHAHALLRLASTRHKLGHADAAREALEAARVDLEALPDPGMLSALETSVAAELAAQPRHEGFYGQPLSDAELRVLALLAAGRSVSDVARELYLAPNTVKTHRRTIYRKLGVTTRQEAIARAAELGLARRLEPDDSSRMNVASEPSRPRPTAVAWSCVDWTQERRSDRSTWRWTMSTKSSMAGWIGFAGIVMLILAGIDVIQGLIALFDDNYYVVSHSGFLVVDLTAWGWTLLIYGVILALVGSRAAGRQGLGALVHDHLRVGEHLRPARASSGTASTRSGR